MKIKPNTIYKTLDGSTVIFGNRVVFSGVLAVFKAVYHSDPQLIGETWNIYGIPNSPHYRYGMSMLEQQVVGLMYPADGLEEEAEGFVDWVPSIYIDEYQGMHNSSYSGSASLGRNLLVGEDIIGHFLDMHEGVEVQRGAVFNSSNETRHYITNSATFGLSRSAMVRQQQMTVDCARMDRSLYHNRSLGAIDNGTQYI